MHLILNILLNKFNHKLLKVKMLSDIMEHPVFEKNKD